MTEDFDDHQIAEAARSLVGNEVEAQEISWQEKRLREMLAPEVEVDLTVNPGSFDHLFADEDTYQAAIKKDQAEEESRRKDSESYKKRFSVTEQSVAAAVEQLRWALIDPVIHAAVIDYAHDKRATAESVEVVEAIRRDASLRYSVGKRLQEIATVTYSKDHELTYHEGVNPSYPGYDSIPHLLSGEYAGLLTLAMLDGTYKDEKHYNSPADGRHRRYAEAILKRIRSGATRDLE